LDVADVLQRLGSDVSYGLTTTEANRRLKDYGFNELTEQQTKSAWRILWEQLSDTLVVILLVAAIVSGFLGYFQDAIAIVAIVVLIALLGFSQEYRAQTAIANLKKLAIPSVKVRRSDSTQTISARQLVPGDIVLLEAEDLVPADCRLIESSNLRVQEAALTGVSEPVDKDPQRLSGTDLMLSERSNTIYMGTVVTYGSGTAIVTETGMRTELGRITAMVQTVDSEATPLQKRLDQFGRGLAIAALILVGLILVLGLLRGENPQLMFLTAITLVVAALPEGLPAVVTISLALGAQKMLKRRALIRKLPAVETLGSVTVICSGKTGTLTENRMTVTVLDVVGGRLDLPAHGHWTSSLLDSRQQRSSILLNRPVLTLLLTGGSLCNDAQLEPEWDEPRYFHVVGDPTEGALVMASARLGLWKAELDAAFPRIAERSFDSHRQLMTTVHQWSGHQWGAGNGSTFKPYINSAPYVAFTKGAVDRLLAVSSYVWVNEQAEPLNEAWCDGIRAAHQQLIQDGLRVVGLAFRSLSAPPQNPDQLEQDLIFIGLVGMSDPARPQAREAVLTCKSAGIRPVMITGDHPLTAHHMARELGIVIGDELLTGEALCQLSEDRLVDSVDNISVYARVSPQQKFEIVQALQKRGHIIAMTGDGMNDAPALKKANIGIAMGISGTDSAKEAADLVLLDDNFATIIAAVKEGRIIYDNIRKFIKYLLSSNVGELWVMLLAPFLGMPLPLLPLQILWINLLTDGLPALALGLEPAERHTMNRPPHDPNENFFGRGMGRSIVWIGLFLGLVCLSVGYQYWRINNPTWQTMLFSTLTLSQMGNALALRSDRDSLFQIGLLSNKPLLGAVLLTLGLQLAVVYIPVLQTLFSTTALSTPDLLICVVASTIVFWAVELEKWLKRRVLEARLAQSATPQEPFTAV
jgi:Ca2+-transporting ATPase